MVEVHLVTAVLQSTESLKIWRSVGPSSEIRHQPKFLAKEIADFRPSTHAQSDIPGHAFRKRWLFIEISNMLRTD